jgi:hypothetical protein
MDSVGVLTQLIDDVLVDDPSSGFEPVPDRTLPVRHGECARVRERGARHCRASTHAPTLSSTYMAAKYIDLDRIVKRRRSEVELQALAVAGVDAS